MVLAHQGGWDEALMVLAPIGLLFLLLWIANRRAKRQLEQPSATGTEPTDDEPAEDELR